MTKRYEITGVPHYIGGRLRGVGDIVTLPEGISPGRHLVEVGGGAQAAADDAAQEAVGPFKIKHNGGGNFVVMDSKGMQVGDVFKKDADDAAKAKTEAQAQADLLNGPTEPVGEVGGGVQLDSQLPDA